MNTRDDTSNLTHADIQRKINYDGKLMSARALLLEHLHGHAGRYQTYAECVVAADYLILDLRAIGDRACECGEDSEEWLLRAIALLTETRGKA